MELYSKPLFVFEMANNHQGDVSHGKMIIRELEDACKDYTEYFNFAIKLQYRDLDTFIHPDFQGREDIKNVKRFRETRLNESQFKELYDEIRECRFYAICTPFDEPSVDLVVEHGYDVIKIASCSCTDWPLLEKIAKQDKPVIASAAGASLEDIMKVVNFFRNRRIDISLMHCIAEYPAENSDLQMNQIDLYRETFKDIRVGFSTHENPDILEPIKIAVAKGAVIFEKHVGVETDTIKLNAYSATPEQIRRWLASAIDAFKMCGIKERRYEPNQNEKDDLAALQRGVFAKSDIETGKKISMDNVYLAFPCQKGQLLASHLSKYNTINIKNRVLMPNEAVMLQDVSIIDDTSKIKEIVAQVMDMLKKSNVVIPINSTCEISHHYGINRFYETGVTMINCINREYCKKILVVLPNQSHPGHFHKKKEETFTILYGELELCRDGIIKTFKKGEAVIVERNINHSFKSKGGCVFEEISTTHYGEDSFYYDKQCLISPRKTEVYITKEMLSEIEI